MKSIKNDVWRADLLRLSIAIDNSFLDNLSYCYFQKMGQISKEYRNLELQMLSQLL